jgi:hypothetical protein
MKITAIEKYTYTKINQVMSIILTSQAQIFTLLGYAAYVGS